MNRADTLFRYVQATVETAALSDAATGILPEAFWASRPGALYLSASDGRLVRLTASGPELLDNGTDGVLFAAGRTLAPWRLVAPASPFDTCTLFREARCSAAHGPDLLRLWMYSLPTNSRNKPPLCATGPVGSGKTKVVSGICDLWGIPFVAHSAEEEGETDFWPGVDQGGIYCLDNADSRVRWLPDALAAAATGGCSQRRRLYTNAETVTLRARAWVAVTSANPLFAHDAGLADRLLVVRMERRESETADSVLSDQIAAHRDAGLSHIASTLCAALADQSPTPAGLNKRHPDFASFAVRIGRALDRETEAVHALQTAETDKSAFCLENDGIGAALLAAAAAGPIAGTAAEILPRLIEADPELRDRLSAKRLGKRLVALWPHIQAAFPGATAEKDRKGFTVFRISGPKPAEFAEFQTAFP